MMRWLALVFCALSPLLQADQTNTEPFAKVDSRAIRELQNHAFGSPRLEIAAPREEALLALADLSAAESSKSSGATFSADDRAALFSLLQRYRDELLALGMDSAEMDEQLKALEARSSEIERRLASLWPKDGLKISGRFFSAFDDLHLLGNASLPAFLPPGPNGKPAQVGIRVQVGQAHGSLKFSGTRGPVTGFTILDVVSPWGLTRASLGFRRVYLEIRTPIVLQFGDIDVAQTPLTLWRYDESPWFEPEPFKSRRMRAHDDLLLVKDRWRVSGLRATTEMKIFDSLVVDLSSITAIVGNQALGGIPSPPVMYLNEKGQSLGVRYATYLEAWSLGMGMGPAIHLSYNGSLTWDVTEVVANPIPSIGPMSELVQSVGFNSKIGSFGFDFEAALSAFTAAKLSYTAALDPLTGTAVTVGLNWSKEDGYIKLFGRAVSSGYHAAGAQGRTIDYDYQFLGPFLNEQSNIGANGTLGLDPSIKPSYASRLNDRLIPAGVYNIVAGGIPSPWLHLLAYGPGEEIDPYGPATPNRVGFGSELQWAFFEKGIKPMVSYESFQQQVNVFDSNTGLTLTPFVMTRIRAGLELNLEPSTSWPVRFGAGYTSTDSANGQKDALGVSYDLATTLLDASVQLWAGRPMGLNFGYRQMLATGKNERTIMLAPNGITWDIAAAGGWWKPMPEMIVDLVYSVGHTTSVDVVANNLEVDQILLRLTTEF